ncbi:MAG: thiolase family protein [Deltaproteobacteria bacterium]|nr:thiolase family protein [Deltaproteobacteria bacterium]
MKFRRACIPIGFAWTSPFARWQGPLAEISSLDLAVLITRRALEGRDFGAEQLSQIILGWTVPQQGVFYGAPTVAARIGAPNISGPMISQACATSAACVQAAASALEAEAEDVTLLVLADRMSNGPLIFYPTPSAQAGAPLIEHWVLDNFRRDPCTDKSMLETAENVAQEAGISREELDDLTLLRYEQYQRALADDRAFQRRYMVPVVLESRRGDPTVIDTDVGVYPTTAEGLAKLKAVKPSGVITYGTQTYPADGAAGMLLTTEERARELSKGGGVVRLLSSGFSRVAKATMPKAPVPAAHAALNDAGLRIKDVDAVTTHNPFAVNDIWFSRQTEYPLEKMNLYGCSLIYGHPQAPTGARAIAELIETLRRRGGGVGLFTGCAAGDTGAAILIRVQD